MTHPFPWSQPEQFYRSPACAVPWRRTGPGPHTLIVPQAPLFHARSMATRPLMYVVVGRTTML